MSLTRSEISTQNNATARPTALDVIVEANGGALPAEGILAIDIEPGSPIGRHTLDQVILKLSIHLNEDYTPERDAHSGQIIPNRATELVDEAARRGWTHERCVATVSAWLFSAEKKYEKWRPSEVLNFELGERVYGYDWYLSQENRRAIEIYHVEGHAGPFFKPMNGKKLPALFERVASRTPPEKYDDRREFNISPMLRELIQKLEQKGE